MNQSLTYGNISTAVSKQRDPCLSEMQEARICQLFGGENGENHSLLKLLSPVYLSAYKNPPLPSTALQKKKLLIMQVYV